MSKPCITKVGTRKSCRSGLAVFDFLGFDEFLAYSDEEYIEKAYLYMWQEFKNS